MPHRPTSVPEVVLEVNRVAEGRAGALLRRKEHPDSMRGSRRDEKVGAADCVDGGWQVRSWVALHTSPLLHRLSGDLEGPGAHDAHTCSGNRPIRDLSLVHGCAALGPSAGGLFCPEGARAVGA